MIPFEYFAPPGDSEVEVYANNLIAKHATAQVDAPLIVNGLECQPFEMKKEEGVEKRRIKLTSLSPLPQKIQVKNPNGSLVYLRILMDLEKVATGGVTGETEQPLDPGDD